MNCKCGKPATHIVLTLKTMAGGAYCVGCMRGKLAGGGDAKRTGAAADVAAAGGARRATEAGGQAAPADGDAGGVGDQERAAVAPRDVQAAPAAGADGTAVPVFCQQAGCLVELTGEQVENLTAIGQPLLCVDHQLAASRAAKAAKKVKPKPSAEPEWTGRTVIACER